MLKRMMLLVILTLVLVPLAAGSGAAANLLKVAVVDLQGALNATSEGIAAKETLRKKHMAKQEQVDKMKAELDTLEEKIKSPVISADAQAELKEEYRLKKGKLIEFVTVAKEEEDRENQQLSAGILEGLVQITREIAETDNYSIILEKSGSAVVYFEDSMDITDRVVKTYNQRHQGGSAQ